MKREVWVRAESSLKPNLGPPGGISAVSRVHMCYAMRPADHTRENAARHPDQESTLWRGFSSAMPARIKPGSVRSINTSKPWGLRRGWMKWTFYLARTGSMRSSFGVHQPYTGCTDGAYALRPLFRVPVPEHVLCGDESEVDLVARSLTGDEGGLNLETNAFHVRVQGPGRQDDHLLGRDVDDRPTQDLVVRPEQVV